MLQRRETIDEVYNFLGKGKSLHACLQGFESQIVISPGHLSSAASISKPMSQ